MQDFCVEGKVTDERLLENFVVSGNPLCFEELYFRHRKRIYYLCLSVVKNRAAAEDLVQDVFTSAFSNCHTCRSPAAFGSWLSSIARHASLNWLKSNSTIWQPLSPDVPDVEEPDARRIIATIDLDTARSSLSAKQRKVLDCYRNGWRLSEISQITGEPKGKVRSHLQNGIRNLSILLRGKPRND